MGEQVYFALSRDGLHWKDLNQSRPVLMSSIGEKGVRDPYIIKSPIDQKYYIIATDLRIANGQGWPAAKTVGSRDMIVWESEDLTHWSKERSVTVGVAGAGCVWAPEAVYDEEKKAILVFWASNIQLPGEESRKQRIYASYTTDFREFTKPEIYIERDNNVIDTTIWKEGDYYFRYSKDETTKHIRADFGPKLTGEFTHIPSGVLAELHGVEGPAMFKFNDREEWCLIADQFKTDGGYLPLLTKDLRSGEFIIPKKGTYDMGESKKRHGSVLSISEEEFRALEEHYGY